MRDVADGVHPGIRASRTGDGHGVSEKSSESCFEGLLDTRVGRLNLPPVEGLAAV